MEDFVVSDDGSVIQIVTDNYYEDENIPNLIRFLSNKKNDKIIKDFDVDTFQDGYKLSDDQIVVVIEK